SATSMVFTTSASRNRTYARPTPFGVGMYSTATPVRVRVSVILVFLPVTRDIRRPDRADDQRVTRCQVLDDGKNDGVSARDTTDQPLSTRVALQTALRLKHGTLKIRSGDAAHPHCLSDLGQNQHLHSARDIRCAIKLLAVGHPKFDVPSGDDLGSHHPDIPVRVAACLWVGCRHDRGWVSGGDLAALPTDC